MVMEIVAVDKDSPLFGLVRPGFRLIAINQDEVRDRIDYMYCLDDEPVRLDFEDQKGTIHSFNFDYLPDPGLTFRDQKILRCKNRCIFCFVHQQPKGMRKSLYIKDDDYRLSFTHGNFVTLSNLNGDDIKRIIRQRLSPLYVSIHTTDDNLRRSMFRNSNLPSILDLLKKLIDKGIVFHTQVVVCPEINDGRHLEKTIDDLYSLYPGVRTVGVVPIGLTKYRKGLTRLRTVRPDEAKNILDFIHKKQRQFLKESDNRFAFAADEFYILAGQQFPKISEYEEMEQFENGIGMTRYMLTDFNRRKKYLMNIENKKRKKITCLTGESAYKVINENVAPYLKQIGFNITVFAVKNRFWGRNVTVSGLLTGRDLLRAAKKVKEKSVTLTPPNCLNNDNLFLDDMALDDFRKKLGCEVIVGKYSMVDTIREIFV